MLTYTYGNYYNRQHFILEPLSNSIGALVCCLCHVTHTNHLLILTQPATINIIIITFYYCTFYRLFIYYLLTKLSSLLLVYLISALMGPTRLPKQVATQICESWTQTAPTWRFPATPTPPSHHQLLSIPACNMCVTRASVAGAVAFGHLPAQLPGPFRARLHGRQLHLLRP